ncbi:MAG: gliding motility-associated ABC transporter ATP-binding subunit GldA [Saprospiraceae bacterium]|nr:gliding motility-associated ABC transporter ATP-binding subunit GldA [Candidatus Vicinibacter affinis]MBK6824212.1 gliding motility-associated ABC transporter ATP-binding subunit GldA [Candidatus Vicinibacter affinis]MBK7303829.1 gliding motility-associated ABC transporter ATP-binding subunit GldA [Candidatus Vicinibacter affinis]MBK8403393.1 gliding motility-associated ABC transporter ATP-binding subunit GldA [Candidatus Vicinibacter affinis]MBK8643474.1 gliding motility-associated ABC tran
MSIQVENLVKIYGSQRALNDISFTAGKGQILGFLGPNGAGKTTTMKILTGFLFPTSGKASVCGYDLSESPLEAKRKIGYLPEHNPLYKDMYIREYLLTFAKISQIQNPKKRVEELIELTGLTKEQNKLIGSLSKGYRQRVGLSQALLHDPEVLILDEPTSGLDPNQIQDIRDLIRNFGKEKTLIFSTHIMQEVKALCDRVIIINNGSIVADDPIDMLQEKLSDRQIVHVEFNKDLPIDLLKNIPGVQSVRTNGKARFTVYSSNQKDLREMLFNFSVQNNYIIYEMNKDKNSVEEVFSLLTKSSPKD